MARTKDVELSCGVAVTVKGMGKHAKGIISRNPAETVPLVWYRSDYNKGEHCVAPERVKVRKNLTWKGKKT